MFEIVVMITILYFYIKSYKAVSIAILEWETYKIIGWFYILVQFTALLTLFELLDISIIAFIQKISENI